MKSIYYLFGALLSYMKSIYYLFGALLSYIIPVVIFGHWNIYTGIYFPISTLLLLILINYKAIDGKEWPAYLYSGFHGFSISIFGISIFGFTKVGTLVSLSVYWGALVFFISAVPFVILAGIYRNRKKVEYEKQFNDNQVAIERDKKINKILRGF